MKLRTLLACLMELEDVQLDANVVILTQCDGKEQFVAIDDIETFKQEPYLTRRLSKAKGSIIWLKEATVE